MLALLVLPAWPVAEAATGLPEPTGETIVLPPFLVDGEAAAWTFARSGNLEILSLLPTSETREFAAGFLRAKDAFDLIVPSEFQASPTEPLTIILWDRRQRKTIPEETLRRYWPGKSFNPALPNLLIRDLDQWTLFCTPGPAPLGGPLRFRLTPQFTLLLLASHRPSPAPWAMKALAILYEHARDEGGRLALRLPAWNWKLETGPEGLPPLSELLAENNALGEGSGQRAIGRQLFALWALQPGAEQHASKFWNFVRRTSTEPTTEAVFKECFGFDYAEADKKLLALLKSRERGERPVSLLFPSREHSIQLESPDPQTVARIKGNWMRLAASLIVNAQPELRAAYRSEGRRSVVHALSKTNPEPELLRVLALLAYDEGKSEEAREVLERIYGDGARNAIVGIALSRLRLAGMKEPLDAAQVDSVLDPLWQCCRRDSPPEEAVQLAAKILAMCAVAPRQGDMVQLLSWAKLFPRKPALLVEVALIARRYGYHSDARQLLQLALRHAPAPGARHGIEELLTQLPP